MYFLPFLIVLPLLELAVFGMVTVGMGLLFAFFLLFAAAAVGIALIQTHSLGSLFLLGEIMEGKRLSSDKVFNSLCMAAAGILFLAPGFISDALAIALLIPVVRSSLKDNLQHRAPKRPDEPRSQDVLEGEYERTED